MTFTADLPENRGCRGERVDLDVARFELDPRSYDTPECATSREDRGLGAGLDDPVREL